MSVILLRGVSHSYDGNASLRGVDLGIGRGEAVALIGPNGSGKSTLLKLLCGIVPPLAGSYVFDGEEVTPRRLKDERFAKRFHQRIQLLFPSADGQLFCPSVREEVAFGPRQMGFGDEEVTARVSDCCGLLEIGHLAHRAPWLLSEGEKRKVALASILSLNPEVLALDEPLSGLDPRTRGFLRELLASLIARGKTVVCATHDYPPLAGVLRRAVVFSEEHRIVRDGSFTEVTADTAFMRANNLL